VALSTISNIDGRRWLATHTNHGAVSDSSNKYKLVRPGMLLNFGTSSAAVRGDMITTDLLLPLCRKPRFRPTA